MVLSPGINVGHEIVIQKPWFRTKRRAGCQDTRPALLLRCCALGLKSMRYVDRVMALRSSNSRLRPPTESSSITLREPEYSSVPT